MEKKELGQIESKKDSQQDWALILHDDLSLKARLEIRKKNLNALEKLYFWIFKNSLSDGFLNYERRLFNLRLMRVLNQEKSLQSEIDGGVKYLMDLKKNSLLDLSDHKLEEEIFLNVINISNEMRAYVSQAENGEMMTDETDKKDETFADKVYFLTDYARNHKNPKIHFRTVEHLGIVFADFFSSVENLEMKREIVEAMVRFGNIEEVLTFLTLEAREDQKKLENFNSYLLKLIYQMTYKLDGNVLLFCQVCIEKGILTKSEINVRIANILNIVMADSLRKNLGFNGNNEDVIRTFFRTLKTDKNYLRKYFLNLNKKKTEADFEIYFEKLLNLIKLSLLLEDL